MSTAKPKRALTEEETLRREHVIECLTQAKGGYHYASVGTVCRCSPAQARSALLLLEAEGLVEQYDSYANTRLWKLKGRKFDFALAKGQSDATA